MGRVFRVSKFLDPSNLSSPAVARKRFRTKSLANPQRLSLPWRPACNRLHEGANVDSGPYAACAGLRAQSQALEVAAHNLANLNTSGFSPTIGIIGAVLGLIQVMQHLDNIQEVGRVLADFSRAFLRSCSSPALSMRRLRREASIISSRATRLHSMDNPLRRPSSLTNSRCVRPFPSRNG